jgi:hypothetical protein
MFVNAQNPGEGISAVKALGKANAQGQRIYHITPANQAATLPNIHHNSLVMEEIRNALNAGKEVLTHTDAVSVPGWSGAGYILFDPKTGDGAFKIGGGQNGGWLGATAGFGLGALILGLIAGGIATILLQSLLLLIIVATVEALILGMMSQDAMDCFIFMGLLGIDVALILGPFGLGSKAKEFFAAILALIDTIGLAHVTTPAPPIKQCY